MDTDRPAHRPSKEHADTPLQQLQKDCTAVAEEIRTQDLDAWLAGLLVPAPVEARHWAVWGLVLDVLAVPWKVSDPTLGLIRLQWWLEELAAEAPVAHPLNRLLHGQLQGDPGLRRVLQALVEATSAWLAEPLNAAQADEWLAAAAALPEALAAHRHRNGAGGGCAGSDSCLQALGKAWGVTMLLRRAPHVRRNGLPLLRDRETAGRLLEDGWEALHAARRGQAAMVPPSAEARALLRAFALAPLWLKAAARALAADGGEGRGASVLFPLVPPSQAARQWRLLRLRLTGRPV